MPAAQKRLTEATEKNRTSGDPLSEARKPKNKSQALGQVFTEPSLSKRMVYDLGITKNSIDVSVLDPCVGPYTFPRAIRELCGESIQVTAFDIDPEMCQECERQNSGFSFRVNCEDYLLSHATKLYDFAVLNPPYVRQEWIREKSLYREHFSKKLGINIPGTSNLYVYFIVKSILELKHGGKISCIVYDSWQSTIYGQWLKNFLNTNTSKWRAEAAPPLPFEGRLIDATIIYAERGAPSKSKEGPGPKIQNIKSLNTIDELFETRRGLRLKQANFFMTTFDSSKSGAATQFVKKVSRIPGYVVPREHPEAAFLWNEDQGTEETLKVLLDRIEEANKNPTRNTSILTWYKDRPSSWMRHSKAPTAPIIFNYYLRNRPKHIGNPSDVAYSDNFYGLTPRSLTSHQAWLAALNSTISAIGILSRSRNQGAGLAKIQLFEYRASEVLDIQTLAPEFLEKLDALGSKLLTSKKVDSQIIGEIDKCVFKATDNPEFAPSVVQEKLRDVEAAVKSPAEVIG